jgi:replicative DNA helicase
MAVSAAAVSEFNRRPIPFSEEAEIAVLSCAFLSPQEALHVCAEKIRPDHFHRPAHRSIYEMLLEMNGVNEAIDLVTVTQKLSDSQLLEKIGGPEYLHEILTSEATSANIQYYLDILRQKYVLRQLIDTGTDIVRQAYEGSSDASELLDAFEQNVFKIRDRQESSGIKSIKDIVGGALHKIDQLHESRGKLKGVSWGFRDLNKITFGLNPGNMIVVAARPGVGKTSLAMNVVERLVLPEEKEVAEGVAPLPVAVFSLEMTAEELAMRMIFSRSRVNMYDLREGRLSRSDLEKLVRVGSRLGSCPLFVDDTPGIPIMQLRAKARRLRKQHNIQLIVIDYLQLVRGERRRDDNREREVAEISGALKGLAKELDVPVMVISQLNRETAKDGSRPTIANLRESGAIEQDADVVCLLSDPRDPGAEDSQSREGGVLDVLVAKNRHGMTDDVKLTFIRRYTRFEDFVEVA